jgi:hypothetical protein
MTPRVLSTEEAVHRIVTGDHRDGARGSLAVDVALIDLLQEGTATASLRPDDTLVIRLTKAATR